MSANNIYIAVRIIDYGNGFVRCSMSQSVNDEPLKTVQLTKAHAQKLQWELVLAGGKRTVTVNSHDRTIVSADTYIFLPC